MQPHYDLWLVGCSYLVAVAASFATFQLGGRVIAAKGSAAWVWIATGAIAMGLGIWSMHFIAMLAIDLPITLAYDPRLTLLSIVPAIASAAGVLSVLKRGRSGAPVLVPCAVVLGAGIASMHYVGMAAIKLSPPLHYDWLGVSASVGVAVLAGYGALRLAFAYAGQGPLLHRATAAFAMGAAVCAMHYTGMAAAHFEANAICTLTPGAVNETWLGWMIAGGVGLLLVSGTIIAGFDARHADENARLVTALRETNQALIERRQRAETLAREAERSKQEFQNAFAHAAIGMSLVSPEGRFLRVNQALCQLLGYTEAEMLTLTFQQLTHASDLGADVANVNALLSGEVQSYQLEKRYLHRDGHVVWALLSVSLVRTADGAPVHFISQVQDITARKSAERALAQSEARFRSLTEMSSDWLWEQDAQFRFNYLSKEAGVFSGRSNDSIMQVARWDQAGIDKLGSDWAQHRADCLAHRPFRGFQYRRLGDDGIWRWLSVSGDPIFSEDGSFAGYRGTGQDITQRVAAQHELGRHRDDLQRLVHERTKDLSLAKDQAEAASRAKSQFLANMSHELRTPMHAILSFAELGTRQVASGRIDPPRLGKYYERIEQSGQRLMRLLNDLLDLSKLEAGKMQFKFGLGNLTALTRDVTIEFSEVARSKNVDVRVEETQAEIYAWCDADRIRQVVRNLLSNAIKFTPEGGQVLIEVADDEQSNEARISVRDTGIGIPPAELHSIFDYFVQSSRTDRGAGGTGLGLAISREILTQHNGRIEARNNEDRGATVSLHLPRRFPADIEGNVDVA